MVSIREHSNPNNTLQKFHHSLATEESDAEKVSVTAADALNDANSLRLGMGDFVFYSVLVGQAATTVD
ncbi:hypothetical protein ANCDUO_06337 [Ancylostoma duodenale]|uniref:Uncharacterized protein n=1 Tax=Ancylostoma duodenale TaxID=51022 RepID=A0A0C2H1Y6_9BILA|nr:hypothetical protein ANCDUO_06337 [Ancylostoma duodenale]